MPGPIYVDRGPFVILEELLRELEAQQAALEVLEAAAPGSLGELAGARDTARSRVESVAGDDVAHFRDHWLGSWWPDHPVEAVLRHGFIQALRAGQRRQLPVEVLWVTGADTVQAYVAESPSQITLLVYTPVPPEATGRRAGGVRVVGVGVGGDVLESTEQGDVSLG